MKNLKVLKKNAIAHKFKEGGVPVSITVPEIKQMNSMSEIGFRNKKINFSLDILRTLERNNPFTRRSRSRKINFTEVGMIINLNEKLE